MFLKKNVHVACIHETGSLCDGFCVLNNDLFLFYIFASASATSVSTIPSSRIPLVMLAVSRRQSINISDTTNLLYATLIASRLATETTYINKLFAVFHVVVLPVFCFVFPLLALITLDRIK